MWSINGDWWFVNIKGLWRNLPFAWFLECPWHGGLTRQFNIELKKRSDGPPKKPVVYHRSIGTHHQASTHERMEKNIIIMNYHEMAVCQISYIAKTHTIHIWHIYLHFWLIFFGKCRLENIPYMNGMGNDNPSPFHLLRYLGFQDVSSKTVNLELKWLAIFQHPKILPGKLTCPLQISGWKM